jgi:hypothetical protein
MVIPPPSFIDSQILVYLYTHLLSIVNGCFFFLNVSFIGFTLTLPLSRQERGGKRWLYPHPIRVVDHEPNNIWVVFMIF